jgi:hypothetical protein
MNECENRHQAETDNTHFRSSSFDPMFCAPQILFHLLNVPHSPSRLQFEFSRSHNTFLFSFIASFSHFSCCVRGFKLLNECEICSASENIHLLSSTSLSFSPSSLYTSGLCHWHSQHNEHSSSATEFCFLIHFDSRIRTRHCFDVSHDCLRWKTLFTSVKFSQK